MQTSVCYKRHLLLQDCHRLKSRKFPTQLFSSGHTKSAGVAIMVSQRFQGEVLHKEAEIKGRLLTYRFSLGALTFTIGSVYAPNERQEQFLHKALTETTATMDRKILLGAT